MKIDPVDAIEAARPLIAVLKQLGVPCYLGGSLASSIHGHPRSTIDADVVADLRPEHVDRLVALLSPTYHADVESIRRATLARESFNLIHPELLVKIDVFVLRHYRYERQVMDHVKPMAIDPADPDDLLPFCSAEDIILHKLMWYDQGGRVSERQWSDLLTVMKVQAGVLDQEYLKKWSDSLDVTGLLLDAFKQAGLQQ